jgi:hypothetical protein
MTINKKNNFLATEMERSGIEEATYIKYGIEECLDKVRVSKLLNTDIKKLPEGPYLIFPYGRDYHSVKPAQPRENEKGKLLKYERPYNQQTRLYIPGGLNNINKRAPIIITEGEKKALKLKQILPDATIISVGGVWTWRTKNSNGDSIVIDDIKNFDFKDTRVCIVFDSDIKDNPKIQQAEGALAKYLALRGASVQAARIPAEGDDKVGIDDYIIKNTSKDILGTGNSLSPQSLLKKLFKDNLLLGGQSPEEILSKIEDTDDKTLAYKRYLPVLSKFSDFEITPYLNPLSKSLKITKGDLKSAIKEGRKNEKRSKRNHNEDNIIIIDPSVDTIKSQLNSITAELLNSDLFYKEGDQIVAIIDNSKTILDKNNAGALVVEATEINYCGTYRVIPQDLSMALVHNPRFRSKLNELVLFTDTSTYNSSWEMVDKGYNPLDKIYCLSGKISTANTTKHLDKLLSGFCFKNEASRTNAIAMILSALIRHKFQGEKPFAPVTGNQPGLGKSTLCDVISIISTGRNRGCVRYTPNQDELEKRVASILKSGSEILNFDNVTANKEISSVVLDQLITAKRPLFRLLGGNDIISKDNTFIVTMSVNNAILSKDLLTRMCPIELFFQGNPSERKFEFDVKEFTTNFRDELISELFGLVERWKLAGKKEVSIDSRFPAWSSIIGGILEANNIPGFMSNFKSAMNNYNKDIHIITNLFVDLLNAPTPAADLCQRLNDLAVLDKDMDESSFGKFISPYLGEEIEIAELQGKIEKTRQTVDGKKLTVYTFKTLATPKELDDFTVVSTDPHTTIINVKPGTPNELNLTSLKKAA